MLGHLSKIFYEVRIMATRLPAWRFLILSVIGLLLAIGAAVFMATPALTLLLQS